MTKEWVKMMNDKDAEPFKNYPMDIVHYYDNIPANIVSYFDTDWEYLIDYVRKSKEYNFEIDKFIFNSLGIQMNMKEHLIAFKDSFYDNDVMPYIKTLAQMCENYYEFLCNPAPYDICLDSEIKHFCGDIIITDPCYIGYDMEDFGIVSNTIYGDWSCTTFDMDTKEPIGEFCADAGLVGVFQLDDVLKYNPDFDYHINKKWTTTLIKDFDGDVQIKIKKETGIYNEYHKKGDEWTEYVCYVEGHGVNKVTGEQINFITSQTGF